MRVGLAPPNSIRCSGSIRKQRRVQRQHRALLRPPGALFMDTSGSFGRDRAHHWRIAYASAKETDVHLGLHCLSGAVPLGKAIATLNLFDEIRAMTWRLPHPSR